MSYTEIRFPCTNLRVRQLFGQFYAEEPHPVLVTKRTTMKNDEILKKMVKCGIVSCRRFYTVDFDSWIQASPVKFVENGHWP